VSCERKQEKHKQKKSRKKFQVITLQEKTEEN